MSKPETQKINVHDGINAHGAMGEQEAPQPPPPGQIPPEVIEEAQKQVDGGAAFFGKPLSECNRGELYAAVIMGWYDAQNVRQELAKLGVSA